MASSNRHWPSMFKSKPCNTHHQWQHELNPSLMSNGCHRAPYSSVPGCEERSPEPKPRWNPKPEQIRILEAIFNSGMVNPPRDEIRKIRAQLQEYGQVGDANVFYWFQNRKSRSKHKQRHLQNTKQQQQQTPPHPINTSSIATVTAPSSSSSSSDKSSPIKATTFSVGSTNVIDVSNSPTASVNQQTYFQSSSSHGKMLPESFFFPVQQIGCGSGHFTQGFCFSELSNVVQVPDQTVGACPGFLLSELMMNQGGSKKMEEEKITLHQHQHQHQLSYATSPTTSSVIPPTTVTVPSSINQIQGVGESGAVGPAAAAKSTVFINDVAFEVPVGPFNVREAFGDDAVLLHSSGQPVLTNEWGVTLLSLQHGAFYYLVI